MPSQLPLVPPALPETDAQSTLFRNSRILPPPIARRRPVIATAATPPRSSLPPYTATPMTAAAGIRSTMAPSGNRSPFRGLARVQEHSSPASQTTSIPTTSSASQSGSPAPLPDHNHGCRWLISGAHRLTMGQVKPNAAASHSPPPTPHAVPMPRWSLQKPVRRPPLSPSRMASTAAQNCLSPSHVSMPLLARWHHHPHSHSHSHPDGRRDEGNSDEGERPNHSQSLLANQSGVAAASDRLQSLASPEGETHNLASPSSIMSRQVDQSSPRSVTMRTPSPTLSKTQVRHRLAYKKARVRFTKIFRDVYEPDPVEGGQCAETAVSFVDGASVVGAAPLRRMACRFRSAGCSYFTTMKPAETESEFRKRAASNCWNHEERHCPFNKNKFEPREVRRAKWDYARYDARKRQRARSLKALTAEDQGLDLVDPAVDSGTAQPTSALVPSSTDENRSLMDLAKIASLQSNGTAMVASEESQDGSPAHYVAQYVPATPPSEQRQWESQVMLPPLKDLLTTAFHPSSSTDDPIALDSDP